MCEMIKIIIADDEIFTLEAISNLLDWTHLGYEIVALCSNGREILSYMHIQRVDVVLTDRKSVV